MVLDITAFELTVQKMCAVNRKRIKSTNIFITCVIVLSRVSCVLMDEKLDTDTGITDLSETWKLSDLSEQHFELYKEMLQFMEKLNMFKTNQNTSGCFYLQQIVREISSPNKSPLKIGIHFYFEEPEINSDNTITINQAGNINSDQNLYANGNLKTENCSRRPSLLDIHGLDRLSRKQDDYNLTSTNSSASNSSLTDTSDARQIADSSESQNDKSRGLSRTQVVVIATCSSVIGTFFIIAGAIRIHNCLKRYRANREAALVVARRASAFGFGDSGNIRRDSASSRASRQQSHPASKAGSDTQVDRNGRSQQLNSHHSPQHCSDHNPLLPVHIVGQISDASSSHGSLAFIDEESHRSKQNDNLSGSDIGSEDDPLLRKSPDSGSSVDIGMEADDNVNVKEKHMTYFGSDGTINGRNSKSPNRILTSPDREVVFEPGGETASESSLNMEHAHDVNIEHKDINDTKYSKDTTTSTDTCNSQAELTNSQVNVNLDENVSKHTLSSEGLKLDNIVGSEDNLSKDRSQCKKMKHPYKQFSVDYFDVDDNGVEIHNPIFEELSKETHRQVFTNNAVTTGLTQSDNSLSNNPSYCYGNQTEYDNYGGYGQIGYCCPYISNSDNDVMCLGSNTFHNSLRNSVLLSAENLRRENGDHFSDSFDDTYLDDSKRKGSMADGSSNARCTRMYSIDSYFGNPADQISKFEQSHSSFVDENNEPCTSTDSTVCTRSLHIVPLEEYHSLIETKDEEEIA